MAEITMPQLGETVTEGTITKWLKKVGERVEEDEPIYEVSTDKVDSEVPSPVAGFLAEIKVNEGDTAEVGAVLAVVSDAPPGEGGTAESTAESAEEAGEQPAPSEEPIVAPTPAAPPEQPAAEAQRGPEPDVELDETQRKGPPPQQPPPSEAGDGGNGMARVLSPVVRRLINEHNLDPDQIEGTGAGGRITRADVLRLVEGGRGAARPAATVTQAFSRETSDRSDAAPEAPPAAAPEAAPAAPAEETSARKAPAERAAPMPAARAGDRDEVVPFTNIRRRTAEHMVRSLATSAHTLIVIEVDYHNVDRVRLAAKDRFKEEEGVGLTYLPFISRAVIDAIRDFPHVNASVGDDELIVHRYVNLGIAVDLDLEGLLVPVIHGADEKRLRPLARDIADLAHRARNRRLSPDELSAGTFTITNAGPFGTLITAPVINQPQVAILGTEGVKPRPVAVPTGDGDYAVAVHPVGHLSLSFDHRAYDGAYAAAFVARVKEILETRDWASEL